MYKIICSKECLTIHDLAKKHNFYILPKSKYLVFWYTECAYKFIHISKSQGYLHMLINML